MSHYRCCIRRPIISFSIGAHIDSCIVRNAFSSAVVAHQRSSGQDASASRAIVSAGSVDAINRRASAVTQIAHRTAGVGAGSALAPVAMHSAAVPRIAKRKNIVPSCDFDTAQHTSGQVTPNDFYDLPPRFFDPIGWPLGGARRLASRRAGRPVARARRRLIPFGERASRGLAARPSEPIRPRSRSSARQTGKGGAAALYYRGRRAA